MSSQDIIFILQSPMIRSGDSAQFHRTLETSLSRLKRFNISSHTAQSPKARLSLTADSEPLLVSRQDDQRPEASHKRTLLQAFSLKDLSLDSPSPQRARAEITDVAQSFKRTGCGRSHLYADRSSSSTRVRGIGARHSRRSRMLVDHQLPPFFNPDMPIDDPEVLQEMQRAVSAKEKRSVHTLGHEFDTSPKGVVDDVVYTLPLKLARKQNLASIDPWGGGNPYQLAIDTADCGFWFYELEFKNVEVIIDEADNSVDFVVNEWPTEGKHTERKVIPPGDRAAVKEEGWACYGDQGSVHVRRWEDEHDLKFYLSTWDCTTNAVSETFSRLCFPRILADYANQTIATQASDGNLGIAVPGWRDPWKKATSSTRVTFWDMLRHGQGHVETPMQVTVRLLFPDEERESYAADNVQSFLYHGKGVPCGMLLDGTMLLPEYSPPLYIFPDENSPTEFHFWTLQLLSMTLLEPVEGVSCLDYERSVPAQWAANRIVMPPPDGATMPGLRVIFDTCSSSTALPTSVLRKIWQDWFQQPAEEYPSNRDMTACMWHHRRDRFARHDVVFEFMDYHGTVFNLRCSAQDFLTGPWSAGGQDTRYAQFVSGDLDANHWVLGMNFFWATLLKLNGTHRGSRPVPGIARPYIQLAPQRIVRDGQLVGSAWDLGLHKYLAPRHLAEVWDQPEIHADP